MGFAIAVDDLGAGYSSLSVLAELQPSFIKVDMSIVRGIDCDPRKQRLVDLLCRFADATDATLIAEGVETGEEAAALRECGAHLLQGYLFGKPSSELSPTIWVMRRRRPGGLHGSDLVVDDDTLVLNSVERVLKSAGHDLVTESLGANAIDLAARRP